MSHAEIVFAAVCLITPSTQATIRMGCLISRSHRRSAEVQQPRRCAAVAGQVPELAAAALAPALRPQPCAHQSACAGNTHFLIANGFVSTKGHSWCIRPTVCAEAS